MPIGTVRPYDIFILMAIGVVVEVVSRLALVKCKAKPQSLRQKEQSVRELEAQVKRSRALGPQAFVETSKLERRFLAEKKALGEIVESRTKSRERNEQLVGRIGTIINLLIFVCWYSVPIMEFSGDRVLSPETLLSRSEATLAATEAFAAQLFPLSYLGIGIRISKLGLANSKTSTGALLVVWAAQTTVGKILDGLEALLL